MPCLIKTFTEMWSFQSVLKQIMDYLIAKLFCIFLTFYQANGKFFLIETESSDKPQNVTSSAKVGTGKNWLQI